MFCAPLASAQDAWPSKPLRLIVPFGPGSTPDTLARIVAEGLTPVLGQSVVVENKPGAGGNIGTNTVAKAEPDGYTFGVTISGPLAVNTILFKDLPYDPQKDLAYITIAATQPSVLVVAPSLGVNDVPSLIKKLKENPGKYNFSSMGTGGISHLAMEALAARSGTQIVHVPYAGSSKAMAAILAGETQMAVLPAAAVMAQVDAGKLKALAVATAKRSAVLPDLPTLSESGLENIEGDAWMGFVAPAGTPEPVITRLHDEIVKIMNQDAVKKKLASMYMEPVANTPEEMRATVQADLDRWKPVIEANHIQMSQ
ncbi:tripartite tricarboxylate transporter substrate binding protein [Allopusillimonas soli]|uniref:Tripartite tricarboxylate transporter substrate binding protein n=2 Tax=Allopusillimonas soli TaxID=659016 RepID=A0A853FB35_9BURK|nr:tripartite tricarboxylate transporter substrate binding protein [Allopusillimonas soli]TEA75665.1 tripartite tricarboxylate transporter substrate binding protein [Allopusillimonas soli]